MANQQLKALEDFFINIGKQIGIPPQRARWEVPTILVGVVIGGGMAITGIIIFIVHFASKNAEESPPDYEDLSKPSPSIKEPTVPSEKPPAHPEEPIQPLPEEPPLLVLGNKLGLCKPWGSFAVDEAADVEYHHILAEGEQAKKKMYRRELIPGDDPNKNKYQKIWIGKEYHIGYISAMPREFITAYILEDLRKEGIITGMVPKYRFLKQKDKIIILSEFIKDSSTIHSEVKKNIENSVDLLEKNEELKHGQYVKEYVSYATKSGILKYMLPILLLLGNQDLHANNFLLSKAYENQIIPIDFGLSLEKGISLYGLFKKGFLCKEMLLDEDFLYNLKRVSQSFLIRGELYQIISDSVEDSSNIVSEVCKNSKISKEEILETLDYNANEMEELYWHIQAEMAIANDNLELLEKSLENLHELFPIISQQSSKDGCINASSKNRLMEFVFTRKIKDQSILEGNRNKELGKIKDNNYKEEVEDYFNRRNKVRERYKNSHLPREELYYGILVESNDYIGTKMYSMVRGWEERIQRVVQKEQGIQVQ